MDLESNLKAAIRRTFVFTDDIAHNSGDRKLATSNSYKGNDISLHQMSLQVPDPGGTQQWTTLESPFSILAPLHSGPPEGEVGSTVRAVVLYEEDEVVLAATSLIEALVAEWSAGRKGMAFPHLATYQVVLPIEGRLLIRDGLWSTLGKLVPEMVERYGEEAIEEWMTRSNSLFVVHNWSAAPLVSDGDGEEEEEEDGLESQELIEQMWRETLEYLLSDLPNAKFIFITCGYRVTRMMELLTRELNVRSIPVKLSTPTERICTGMCCKSEVFFDTWSQGSVWKTKLINSPGSRSRLTIFLKNHPILMSCSSVSELIWNVLQIQFSSFQKLHNVPDCVMSEMVLTLAALAYKSEIRDQINVRRLQNNRLQVNLWMEFLQYLLVPVKKVTPDVGFNFYFIMGFQKHVLAAFYIYNEQKPLLIAVKAIRSADTVAVLVGGHLQRDVTKNPLVLGCRNTRGLLKNLYQQSEYSGDPQDYLLKLLNELQCHDLLVDDLFRNAVFPRQVEIFESGLVLKPLIYYLKYAEPKKVLLIVRHGEKNYELQNILQSISAININLGLCLMHHLEWGSPCSSDDLLEVTLASPWLKLQDFIGSLSSRALKNLSANSSMHLSCLRIRVTSVDALAELFSVQVAIQHLMWFEVDFDLSLSSVFGADLPIISTPLCDLSFRDVADSHIAALVDFLCRIRHDYYSGLHLQRSALSVSATIRLLLELNKRDIKLSTPQKVIARYRSWRYPELGVLTKNEINDESKVRHLLGYDDRFQYSDNEVRSDHWATSREIKSLEQVLVSNEAVNYFIFGCSNILIKKNSDGDVSNSELLASSLCRF